MADKEIQIRITAQDLSSKEFEQARRALAGFNDESSKGHKGNAEHSTSLRGMIAGYATGLATWAAASAAIRGVVSFVGESVTEFANAERGQRSLATAMKTAGVYTEGNVRSFANLADEIERTTIYEGDQITSLIAMATQLGVLPSQMDRVIKTAADMASGLGIPIEQALGLLVKANNESVTALNKMGVSLDTARVKGEGLPYVLDEINKRMGGQAAAEVDTYSGSIKQLSNTWGNLKEAIGAAVVGAAGGSSSLQTINKYVGAIPAAFERWSYVKSQLEGVYGPANRLAVMFAALNSASTETAKESPKVEDGLLKINKAIESARAAGERYVAGIKAEAEAGHAKQLSETAKEAAQLAKELKAVAAVPKWQWIADAEDGVPPMLALRDAVDEVPPALRRVGPSLDELADAETVAAAAAFELEDAVGEVPASLRKVGKEAATAGQEIAQKFGDVIRNLPATLKAAFEGGGGLIGAFKSIGVQLGDALAGSMMDRLSKSITAKMASVSSTVLGGFAGIAAIAIAGLSHMASEDARHKAIAEENARTMAEALKQYQEELANVSAEYADLYKAVTRVKLAHVSELEDMKKQLPIMREMVDLQGKIADKEREIADLQDSLVPSWADVQDAAEKYGLSIDGAGQKVQQLKITTVSTDLINDWEMLQRAGWDTSSMLTGMADELSAMAQESVKYGTELPAQMQPILQALADQGKLTDANGNKLKDLSGLKFGAPVKTEADVIGDAIKGLRDVLQEFIDKFTSLAKESETAAVKVQEHWKRAPWADWGQPTYPEPGSPGRPGPGGGKPPGYAEGGLITRPTLAYVAEGGQPELVGPVDFMARALAGALRMAGGGGSQGGGSTVLHVVLNADGRRLAETTLPYTPAVLASMGVR